MLVPQRRFPTAPLDIHALQLRRVRERQVQAEENPGQDEIARFDERCADQSQSRREQPGDEEGSVGRLRRVGEREEASCGAAGGGLRVALVRGFGVGGPGGFGARLRRGAERLDGQPGARYVGGRGGVADPPLGAEDAEDVEDVVAVVGEGEGVHQGVEVDGDEGQDDKD